MTEVPAHLRAIVDRAAGREHSTDGAVMRCLAEVLTVHERDVQRATVEHLRWMMWDGHPSPWFHVVADKLQAELNDPGKDVTV